MIREWIVSGWNGIMDHRVNPLRHIPDLQVRHMMMQILAFMWSSIFAILILFYSKLDKLEFIAFIVLLFWLSRIFIWNYNIMKQLKKS